MQVSRRTLTAALVGAVGGLLLTCVVEPEPSSAPAEEPPTVVVPGPGADDFEHRRKAVNTELRGLVQDLGEAGRYACCIESPCSYCALHSGGCRCAEGLAKGEPVCEECARMWAKGRGTVPGVDPSEVRSFLEAEKGSCDCQ